MRTSIVAFLSSVIIRMIFAHVVCAIPVIVGQYELKQPNGVSFEVEEIKDEFGTYLIAQKGNVVKANDEYYYYGEYDTNGNLIPTDIKVGIDELGNKIRLRHLSLKNHQMLSISKNEFYGKPSISVSKTAKIASDPPDSLIAILWNSVM